MSLIQTFGPLPDESGRGYYRRLASANALNSWKDLARHCGERISNDALLVRPEHVATVLDLNPEWCHAATARDNLARTWTGLRRQQRDAVCVHCLQDSAHVRAIWEHAYLVACPAHKVLLRDSCSACDSPLRNGREQIEFCECGFDLRTMPTEAATPAQVWLSSLLATGNASNEDCGPAMKSADINVTAKLVGALCKHADPQVAARRSNASAPSTIQGLVAFLAPLDSLLGDWPRSFAGHVSERIRLGSPEGRTLNRRLGTWYQQLRKLSGQEAVHPFLTVIGQVAQAEFDGVLGRDAAAGVVNKEAAHVLLLEAAARIGIPYASLTNFRRKGDLTCRRIKSGTNGYVYQVSVQDIDAIVRARELWTPEDEACAALGVPPAVLRSLCEANVLVRDSKWKGDLRKGGPVEVASIERLKECLRRAADTPTPTGGGRRVKLRELSPKHVGDKSALASALQAIGSGVVRPVSAIGPVGDYEFLWNDVAQYYARPALDQGLTVQALSEATGFKHESISTWIGQGLLKSFPVLLRGQPCRVVTPTQFSEFRREFIPLSDLAKELGTKSSAVARQLDGIEIVGSRVLPGGERRGGLVRVADLARAAFRTSSSRAAAPLALV